MKSVINYLKEVRLEMSKVIWPKREKVVQLTLVVFIISVVIGVYVGVLDFGLTKLLSFLIER